MVFFTRVSSAYVLSDGCTGEKRRVTPVAPVPPLSRILTGKGMLLTHFRSHILVKVLCVVSVKPSEVGSLVEFCNQATRAFVREVTNNCVSQRTRVNLPQRQESLQQSINLAFISSLHKQEKKPQKKNPWDRPQSSERGRELCGLDVCVCVKQILTPLWWYNLKEMINTVE